MIGAGRGQGVDERRLAVGTDAEIADGAAEPLEQGREHEPVCVVDRPRRQLGPRFAHLIAGRQQRRPQRPVDAQLATSERRRQTKLGRAKTPSRGKRRLAQRHVLAGVAAVGALADAGLQPHPTIRGGGAIFLHQHRVGAVGHRRPGEDADRLAAPDRAVERVARGGAAPDRQFGFTVGRKIGVGHGIAVDRAVGMRRQVDGSDDIARQDAAGGGAQRHGFGFDDPEDALVDAGKRLVDAQQRAAKGKAVVAQLGHPARPSWQRMKSAITAASSSGSNGSSSPGSGSSDATATTNRSSGCNGGLPSEGR